MEKIYDFRKHTRYMIIHIGNSHVSFRVYQSSDRLNDNSLYQHDNKACMVYNEEKEYVMSFGFDLFEEEYNLNGVKVSNFLDGLNRVSRKNKNTWDDSDIFLIRAVSDYLSYSVKYIMGDTDLMDLTFDSLHYAVVVPSEWKEEIREDLIRCIFTQANLISEDDHKDRIIISSDIESICSFWINESAHNFNRRENIIMCITTPTDEVTALIKLNLVTMANSRFDFANSMLYPTVKYSTSISITAGDIKNCIKGFLEEKLFLNNENNNLIIETLVNDVYNSVQYDEKGPSIPGDENNYDGYEENYDSGDDEYYDDNEEGDYYNGSEENYNDKTIGDELMIPIVINTEKWELNDSQKILLKSICPFDICTIVGKSILDEIKDKVFNNLAKKYTYFSLNDDYTSNIKLDPVFNIWLKHLLRCNLRLLNGKNIVIKFELLDYPIHLDVIISGINEIVKETIQNADMYGPPQINPIHCSNPSLFLNTIPDIIINIDISLNSTLVECSIFNGKPLAQRKFDHNFFTAKKSLPPLGNFYDVFNASSLTVDESFISFADKHLLKVAKNHFLDDLKKLFFRKVDLIYEIEVILNRSQSINIKSTTIVQKNYMKTFLLVYLMYIKEIISSGLLMHVKPESPNLNVGFVVSIEKILLDNVVNSREDLRELIYTSGLIKKDDDSKKLRIAVLGEGMLSSIKQLLKLNLPVKSYFILAHVHENYIQLTLNQAVTATNSENQQESIIIEDKLIYIQNVYDSLCLYIWNNLIQNQGLIKLCETHCKVDNEELLSMKNKKEIVRNLKQYILDNILTDALDCQTFYKNNFEYNLPCNCRLSLTTYDIIEIAFKPFLKNINSIMLSTIIDKEYFGKYKNIDYHISLIYFNHNAYFLKIITDILEKDAIICNPIRGIDAVCTVIPAFKVQPFSPQEFQTGAPHQVYNDGYAFIISDLSEKEQSVTNGHSNIFTKKAHANKWELQVDNNMGRHFIKADDILSRTKIIETIHIRTSSKVEQFIVLELYRYKTSGATKDRNYLKKNETWEKIFDKLFRFDYPEILAICLMAEYKGYSSSIRLTVNETRERKAVKTFEVGLPMTLRYF